MMATKLQDLSIDELSGVGNPANETPGWLVMKSADERETLLKEVDRMESDFAILYAAAKACEPYLADADPSVAEAEQTLVSYVESLFGDEGGEPDEPAEAAPEADTVKTADPTSTSLTELIFGDVEKDADGDETVVEAADVEKDADLEDEADVEKDADTDEDVEKTGVYDQEADEDVEKDADDADLEGEDEASDLVEVLTRLAKGQEDIAKNLGSDIGALREALVSVIGRVENLEVRKTGLDIEADEIAKDADPLGAAVTAALNGGRVTLS